MTENVGKFISITELEDDDIVYTAHGEPFSVAKAKKREKDSLMFGYQD